MKDKKMLSMIIISAIVVAVFIIIMIIIASISGKRLSFEKVEDKMKTAAVNYFKSHESELPKTLGSIVTVSAETLASGKYMKNLSKITPDDSKCSGKVIVSNNGDNYLYSSVLDCGSDYKSKSLFDVVTDKSKVVTSGNGLYATNSGFVYRGENINNVVQLGDTKWAILDVDSDGYMRMIKISGGRKLKNIWDDRYNIKENSNVGINDYSVSRIKDTLISYEKDEYNLTDDFKVYITPKSWCIGKRSETNIAINTDEECKVLSDAQMFGLPYVSDAFMASIDSNCHSTNDASCENYNYLADYGFASWTITGLKETTSTAYYVVAAAAVSNKTSASKNIMPTAYLSSKAMYASGDGSNESPYILK